MENTNPGGGVGPAPFLLKTYEMVDDSSTDDIVAWSSSNTSFIVWNPPEFARILLPTYFKHNNFSSFIRQLNTYGFRKIDPERWEFANEEFVRDQKHLLKNIHRRKPIHSHSQPQGSFIDSERAALEEQIEKLAREKASLQSKVIGFEQQRSAAKHQLEDLAERVNHMAQRQDTLFSFLEKAVQDPTFVEHLASRIDSMDFSAYNKKRRIPQDDDYRPIVESSFLGNQTASRPEFGNVIPDFSDKLRLELLPSSDVNLLSHSTQTSAEDETSSPPGKLSEGEPKEANTGASCTVILGHHLLFVPETLELSDTGASCSVVADMSLQRKLSGTEDSGLNLLAPNVMCNEEDDLMSCHLNLTLASSTLLIDRSPRVDRPPQPVLDMHTSPETRVTGSGKEYDTEHRNPGEGKNLSSSAEAKEGPPAAPVRVNDIFWEQFLTERPGASGNEEASSSYRWTPRGDHHGRSLPRNDKNSEQLSL